MTTTETLPGLASCIPAGRKRLARHSTTKINAGIARIVAATATTIASKVTGVTIVRFQAMTHMQSVRATEDGSAGLVGRSLPWHDRIEEQLKRAGTRA
jgi:hypothetical protein